MNMNRNYETVEACKYTHTLEQCKQDIVIKIAGWLYDNDLINTFRDVWDICELGEFIDEHGGDYNKWEEEEIERYPILAARPRDSVEYDVGNLAEEVYTYLSKE